MLKWRLRCFKAPCVELALTFILICTVCDRSGGKTKMITLEIIIVYYVQRLTLWESLICRFEVNRFLNH